MFHQNSMQDNSTNTQSMTLCEVCGCSRGFGAKGYSAKYMAACRGKLNPQLMERGDAVRHQSLAARLIDPGLGCVGDHYAHSGAAQRNGGGESSRTSAHDKCIGPIP